MNQNAFYTVEKIISKRKTQHGSEYLVKWKNYPHYQNTWEPAKNLKTITNLIAQFEDNEKRTTEKQQKKLNQKTNKTKLIKKQIKTKQKTLDYFIVKKSQIQEEQTNEHKEIISCKQEQNSQTVREMTLLNQQQYSSDIKVQIDQNRKNFLKKKEKFVEKFQPNFQKGTNNVQASTTQYLRVQKQANKNAIPNQEEKKFLKQFQDMNSIKSFKVNFENEELRFSNQSGKSISWRHLENYNQSWIKKFIQNHI